MTVQHPARMADPTVYPVNEPLGEDILQTCICELLRPMIERWLDAPDRVFVGADQFIYYQQYDPTKRYAPDVYVVPGVPQDTVVGAWKTWERDPAPCFALEVVSSNWQKDYEQVPRRCAEIGVGELVVFDPHYRRRRKRPGARWQVFRSTPAGFCALDRTNDVRVWSQALGCWLVSVGEGTGTRVRLATGTDFELVPTPEEAVRAERAAKEAERAAKEAALARVAELEAALLRATVK